MKIYADIYGGIVRSIKETELDFANFAAIWDPAVYWLDITDIPNVEVGDTCMFDGDRVVFEKPKPVSTVTELEVRRTERLDFLKVAFDAALETAVVDSTLGFRINADDAAIRNINSLIVLNNPTVDFCDYNNVFHTISRADLLELQKEVAANLIGLYAQKWDYRNLIKQAPTLEALDSLEFRFTNTTFI